MCPPERQAGPVVGVVPGPGALSWRVRLTGSAEHYLFECEQNPGFRRPVLKDCLTPETEEALAQGAGSG